MFDRDERARCTRAGSCLSSIKNFPQKRKCTKLETQGKIPKVPSLGIDTRRDMEFRSSQIGTSENSVRIFGVEESLLDDVLTQGLLLSRDQCDTLCLSRRKV